MYTLISFFFLKRNAEIFHEDTETNYTSRKSNCYSEHELSTVVFPGDQLLYKNYMHMYIYIFINQNAIYIK